MKYGKRTLSKVIVHEAMTKQTMLVLNRLISLLVLVFFVRFVAIKKRTDYH